MQDPSRRPSSRSRISVAPFERIGRNAAVGRVTLSQLSRQRQKPPAIDTITAWHFASRGVNFVYVAPHSRSSPASAIIGAPHMLKQNPTSQLCRAVALAGLVCGSAAFSSIASAGECPADKVKPGVREPVDFKGTGVTDTVLATLDLSKEPIKA